MAWMTLAFAAPLGADKRMDLARVHAQADPFQRLNGTEGLCQA